MIRESDVISYFDQKAADWDSRMVRNEAVIASILDHADIHPGMDILDVACGTGILIPDYLKRRASSITGIDISPNMIAEAEKKFRQPEVTLICTPAETYEPEKKFDAIMVYNALPHFRDPQALIAHLSDLLKPDGTLTVAHGLSRKRINEHHAGMNTSLSEDLMSIEELSELFAEFLEVIYTNSDEQSYQATGRKHAQI